MSSNVFLKNNIKNNTKNILSSEQSISLPQFINIYDIKPANNVKSNSNNISSVTSSIANINNNNILSDTSSIGNNNNILSTTTIENNIVNKPLQNNINYSPTSSFKQLGGANYSATSNSNTYKVNNTDINNLISMLTSESDMNNSTNTNTLEYNLKNILTKSQSGGTSDPGDDMNTEYLENKLNNILNNSKQHKSLPFIAGAVTGTVATTIMNDVKQKSNVSSEFNPAEIITNTNTNTDPRLTQLIGGGKANPALQAFAKLSKMVSEKLSIPNGPQAKKIAGQLQRDIKEKFPDIELDDILKKGKEHLEKNKSKYEALKK